MFLIKEEKINRPIKDYYEFRFDVAEDGLYLIEIAARARSWKQNIFNFFDDDDLYVKVDGISFPKLNGKNGFFNGEVAWNGNNLKNCRKTNIFIIRLAPGAHKLEFKADQDPVLEDICIYGIDQDQIEYFPKTNNPAEDGDRRQWITYVLIDKPLSSIAISAKTEKRSKNEGDDIKLILDGEIQNNEVKNSRSDWYWQGLFSDGQEKEFKKELNFPKGLHYIELWADKMPSLTRVVLNLTVPNTKRIPTVENSLWTGDFKDDSDEILVARLLFGEARSESREVKIWIAGSVLNRVNSNAWPDSIREVILQKGQYDPFETSDSNYFRIINPLGIDLEKNSWQECYKIADKIISGEIENPTTATHFHGKGVSAKLFQKNIVPQGKFLKKIGETYFYWSPN